MSNREKTIMFHLPPSRSWYQPEQHKNNMKTKKDKNMEKQKIKNKLPDFEKAVIALFLAGFEICEIAELIQMSDETVNNYIRKALNERV